VKPSFLSVCLLFLASGPLWAHAISMSTGYATVRGRELEYIFRIPEYEMAHVREPASLFDHVRFSSNSEDGVRTGQECHPDPANDAYLCAADYRFSSLIEKLSVECTFYQVTVPNHVHMLHAERGGKYDQAILDSSFSSATLAFRPPTPVEIAISQTVAGFLQVFTAGVQMLLLFAAVFSARKRAELAGIILAFLAGQCLGALAPIRSAWQPQPRFAESAAALALAWLSLEILLFPTSRGRWIMAAVLGIFSGLYFSLFINESGYSAGWVMSGAAIASLLASGILETVRNGLNRLPFRASFRIHAKHLAASVLLGTGAIWFVLRLRN
jgi:hypothetical protein